MSNNASPTSAKSLEKLETALDETIQEETCRSGWAGSHLLLNRETGQVLEINCKSWRCPKHRKKWLMKWRVVVSRELKVNPVNKLITLTCASDCTPEQLTLARQLLCRDLRKEFEYFDYLSVLEFTSKTRLPHLHLMARCDYIPQNLLSEMWSKATKSAGIKASPIVYIEAPRSQDAAAVYALSYALSGHEKGQDIPDEWHGRKISYSKGFFKAGTVKEHWISWIKETFEEPEDAEWEVISRPLPLMERHLMERHLPGSASAPASEPDEITSATTEQSKAALPRSVAPSGRLEDGDDCGSFASARISSPLNQTNQTSATPCETIRPNLLL